MKVDGTAVLTKQTGRVDDVPMVAHALKAVEVSSCVVYVCVAFPAFRVHEENFEICDGFRRIVLGFSTFGPVLRVTAFEGFLGPS